MKRFLIVLLALTMVVSLFACNNKTPDESETLPNDLPHNGGETTDTKDLSEEQKYLKDKYDDIMEQIQESSDENNAIFIKDGMVFEVRKNENEMEDNYLSQSFSSAVNKKLNENSNNEYKYMFFDRTFLNKNVSVDSLEKYMSLCNDATIFLYTKKMIVDDIEVASWLATMFKNPLPVIVFFVDENTDFENESFQDNAEQIGSFFINTDQSPDFQYTVDNFSGLNASEWYCICGHFNQKENYWSQAPGVKNDNLCEVCGKSILEEMNAEYKDFYNIDKLVNTIGTRVYNDNIYDEIIANSVINNVSCYTSYSSEELFSSNDLVNLRKTSTGKDERAEGYVVSDFYYPYNQEFYFTGNMKGLTLTFKNNNGTLDIKNAIINLGLTDDANIVSDRKTGPRKIIEIDSIGKTISELAKSDTTHGLQEIYNLLISRIGESVELKSSLIGKSDITLFFAVDEYGEGTDGKEDIYVYWIPNGYELGSN